MMQFNRNEVEDIRLALYDKVEALDEHMKTIADVQAALEKGESVPPFAPGVAGARAARDMANEMEARKGRLNILIDRINAELFGMYEDEDDDED